MSAMFKRLLGALDPNSEPLGMMSKLEPKAADDLMKLLRGIGESVISMKR